MHNLLPYDGACSDLLAIAKQKERQTDGQTAHDTPLRSDEGPNLKVDGNTDLETHLIEVLAIEALSDASADKADLKSSSWTTSIDKRFEVAGTSGPNVALSFAVFRGKIAPNPTTGDPEAEQAERERLAQERREKERLALLELKRTAAEIVGRTFEDDLQLDHYVKTSVNTTGKGYENAFHTSMPEKYLKCGPFTWARVLGSDHPRIFFDVNGRRTLEPS